MFYIPSYSNQHTYFKKIYSLIPSKIELKHPLIPNLKKYGFFTNLTF